MKINKNNLLIIAFQPYDNNMYPPLKIFIDLMGKQINTKYFLFHERGYSFEHTKYLQEISLWLSIIKDIYKLIILLINNKFYKIIVVDHFAFAILSFLTKYSKIIFWSHDITFMTRNIMKTLPNGLNDFIGEMGRREWGPTFAAIIIAIAPTLIVYFFLNKYVMEGVSAGAVKE